MECNFHTHLHYHSESTPLENSLHKENGAEFDFCSLNKIERREREREKTYDTQQQWLCHQNVHSNDYSNCLYRSTLNTLLQRSSLRQVVRCERRVLFANAPSIFPRPHTQIFAIL
jgi:hypothetical protein